MIMATPQRPTSYGMGRGESSALRLLQESTSFDISREDSSSGGFESGALQLESIIFSEERRFPELALTLGRASDDKKKLILIVTQRELAYCPPFGYTSRVQITVQGDGKYQVHILMRELENGHLSNEGEVHALLKRFSDASSHKFCPGIDWTHYHEHYFDVIRYHLKSVHRTEAPFYRIDAAKCKLWFELPSNASLAEKNSAEAVCSACKRLISDLDWQLKRTASESPSRKVKRQAAASRAKLTYMSPASQQKRKMNATMERGLDKKKLARYENTEITLGDEQHTQMCNVVDAIDRVAVDDLQRIFEEGEAHGVGDKLKEVWTTDKRQQLEQFQRDQAKNGKEIINSL